MSRLYTRDDVLRLAPDAGSSRSGQELAQVRKWAALGCDADALWGECQGSGAKPYRVQVDLTEPAFKCSCPSRKFPCKHGLGLMLIYASTPNEVATSPRPDWVAEWLASRADRAAKPVKKQEAHPTASDPAAHAKRREQRIAKVRAGTADLSVWLLDLVRVGLGSLANKGFEFYDAQARRMVDAQAPGIARLLRELPSIAASGAGSHRRFLNHISLVYLLTRAIEQIDTLPNATRADVETAAGIPTAADELSGPAIADLWQVVAQEVELEERLRVQRTWLYGMTTQRPALILQFAHGATSFETVLPAGTQLQAELTYYPGNGMRAAVRSMAAANEPIASFAGCESLDELLDQYSSALAANAWTEAVGLPVKNLTPTLIEGAWWLLDTAGNALPVRIREADGFAMLAIAGGMPVDVALEYDGTSLKPLAVVAAGTWHSLAPTSAELIAR